MAVENIIGLFDYLDAHWRVFCLSMLPITELRLMIPLGIAWGLEPFVCFVWAIAGNFLPIIPLLLVLPRLFRKLYSIPAFRPLVDKLESKSAGKSRKVEHYGSIGLSLLVAVPLPFTGVWTGCLIASLLGLRLLPSLIAVTTGMVIAGILVSLMTAGVLAVFKWVYGLEILLILALLALCGCLIHQRRRRKKF